MRSWLVGLASHRRESAMGTREGDVGRWWFGSLDKDTLVFREPATVTAQRVLRSASSRAWAWVANEQKLRCVCDFLPPVILAVVAFPAQRVHACVRVRSHGRPEDGTTFRAESNLRGLD